MGDRNERVGAVICGVGFWRLRVRLSCLVPDAQLPTGFRNRGPYELWWVRRTAQSSSRRHSQSMPSCSRSFIAASCSMRWSISESLMRARALHRSEGGVSSENP